MLALNKGLEAALHSLMPRALRESLKPNTATYIRARALTAMLVTVTILGAISIMVIAGGHLLTNPALLKYDLVIIGVELLLGLQTWFFYRFNNYWISGLAFTNFYLLAVMTLLIVGGGYEFHGTTILLTCPMISFVIGGREEGIQNACLSIAFFWVLVYLHSIGFVLPNIFYAEDTHVIFSINWVFSVAVVAITLVVYEVELQNRDARLHLRVNSTRQDMTQLSARIEARFHALVPSGLRETLDRRSMAYARAQILTVLLRVATFLCFFASFLIIGFDLAFHPDQFQYDVMILGIAVAFALQTWLFYKYNHSFISGMVLGYFISLVIVGVVLLSGGYDSPILVLMLVCPVAFYMTSGMRDGVTNAILIAITGVSLSYLHRIGFEFTDFFHDAARATTAAIAWFIAVIAIMICMMTYDTELEKL